MHLPRNIFTIIIIIIIIIIIVIIIIIIWSGSIEVYSIIVYCWTLSHQGILMEVFNAGILDSCSFDYLTRDWNLRSFGICIFVFDFCLPLFVIVFAYMFIVKAIVAHEKAMREQAKKMNVTNLRSNAEANAQSAEVRIAKVAMTNVALWLICWTPYAAVVVQV